MTFPAYVKRERSIDMSSSFARESVKPDFLLVPCYARGGATAVSLPTSRVVACNSLLS